MSDDALAAWAEGAARPDERETIALHLDVCLDCRALVAEAIKASRDLEAARFPRGLGEPGDRVLDRYVILERVGAGSMGIVYAAYDSKLDRKVALKELRPGRDSAQPLLEEAKLLARLAHPNVVTVHDVNDLAGRVFITLEYVEGWTLSEWLTLDRRTASEVLDVLTAAGRGLLAAHEGGLVHRDFKPDNVIIGRDGRARVSDFGLAVLPSGLPGGADERRERAGTPRFMAPEQREGRPADARSDQYSFCASLALALFGELGAELPQRADVPKHVRRALQQGLRPRPEDRFRDMRALLAALAPPPRRTRWVSVIGAFTAVTTGLALTTLFSRAPTDPCAAHAQRLEGVWDGPLKGRARVAFARAGGPTAEAAWPGLEELLDRHAAAWIAARRDACLMDRASTEAPSPPSRGRRARCLDRELRKLGALTHALETAEASTVEHALGAARTLSSGALCPDELDLTEDPQAGDAAKLADELRESLAHAEGLVLAGRASAALGLAFEVASSAERAELPGIAADAQGLAAYLKSLMGARKEGRRLAWLSLQSSLAARQHQSAARALIELARIDGAVSTDEGLRWAELAHALLTRGAEGREHAALAQARGIILWNADRRLDALTQLEQALSVRVRLLGARHPVVAMSMGSLGTLLFELGRYGEAESRLAEALEASTSAVGPDHPLTAGILYSMGHLARVRGDALAAEDAYRRSVRIFEASEAGGKEQAALGHAMLGRTLASQGRLTEALAASNQGLTLLGEQTTSHAGLQILLCRTELLRELGRRADAEDLAKRTLELARRRRAGAQDIAGFALAELAELELAANRPARARRLLVQALDALRATFGASHAEVARLLARDAELLVALDRRPEAQRVFEDAARTLERARVFPHALARARAALETRRPHR